MNSGDAADRLEGADRAVDAAGKDLLGAGEELRGLRGSCADVVHGLTRRYAIARAASRA